MSTTNPIDQVLNHYYPSSAPASLHKAATGPCAGVAVYLRRHGLNQLNEKDKTPHQLAPIHVAVLKGDRTVVGLLVDRGASLTVQDATGNTAAHLAAMRGDQEMVTTLRDLAKKTNQQFEHIRNHYLATVTTLERITKYPSVQLEQEVCLMANAKGEIVPLTAKAYLTLTKTLYIEHVVTAPALLCYHWASKTPAKDDFTEQMWQRYLNKKPKVYLEQQVAPETKKPLGLGVRAGETIAPYTLLFPWGGELLRKDIQEQASDYKMDNIECLKFSNIASRVNDGFPVATTGPLNVEGCPDGIGIFSREKLERDQIITIHYGAHACKFGYYEILYREKLEEFCKRSNFEEIKGRIAHLKAQALTTLDGQTVVLLDSEAAPCAYILETPKALVHVITKNLLSSTDLEFLEAALATTSLNSLEGMQGIINNFRKKMMTLLRGMEPLPAFKADFFTILDKLFQKHRVVVAMMTIHFLVNYQTLAERFLQGTKEFDDQVHTIFQTAEFLEKFLDIAADLTVTEKREDTLAKLRTLRERIFRLNEKPLHPTLLPTMVRLVHNAQISEAVLKAFPPNSYPTSMS